MRGIVLSSVAALDTLPVVERLDLNEGRRALVVGSAALEVDAVHARTVSACERSSPSLLRLVVRSDSREKKTEPH